MAPTKTHVTHKPIALTLCLALFVSQTALAIDRPGGGMPSGAGSGMSGSSLPSSGIPSFGQELVGISNNQVGVSEYFYRGDKDDVLVPVYVLGSVGHPGLYHVPIKSDIVTVLSVSGGLDHEADFDKITVKDPRSGEAEKFTMGELTSAGKTPKGRPILGNEIVFVDKERPWISNNTVLVLSVVTGLLSIAIAAKALSDSKK